MDSRIGLCQQYHDYDTLIFEVSGQNGALLSGNDPTSFEVKMSVMVPLLPVKTDCDINIVSGVSDISCGDLVYDLGIYQILRQVYQQDGKKI